MWGWQLLTLLSPLPLLLLLPLLVLLKLWLVSPGLSSARTRGPQPGCAEVPASCLAAASADAVADEQLVQVLLASHLLLLLLRRLTWALLQHVAAVQDSTRLLVLARLH